MTTTPAMPERFTKKPVTIEAVQFTEALRDSIVLDGVPCPEGVKRGATTWHQKDRKVWRADFFIDTLEGRMNVEIGDWIIKGVKGEFYPCKPDIFEMTYDLATLQAQPAEVSDEAIDYAVLQAVGFDGLGTQEMNQFDCRHIARAILALRPQSESDARRAAQEQLYTERERHTAEVKRLQAEIGRLQSLRPQAVPMTEEQRQRVFAAAEHRTLAFDNVSWRDAIVDEVEAHHGITAPAGGEG